MEILFCTDGSQISFNSLENISGWIKDAVIDTICVTDLSFLPTETSIEDFSLSCTNIAENILNYAENKIKSLNFACGKKIKHCGSVIESILEETENNKYDLILMGSHGKKGIQKWLGSVSQGIINNSKISNYISKKHNNKKRLLVTTDGTSCSAGIVKKILPHIYLENKEIYICMVNEEADFLFLDGTIDTNWLLDIEKHQQIYAARAIEEIKNIFEECNVKVTETAILSGIPAQKIIDYSKLHEIDLIIMGSRNKSPMDRFLSGSVSKRTLENVSSDVWIARCQN